MGSRTLGAALAIHVQLWSINPLAIILLFTWAFSPLGGQSFLRMLSMDTVPITTTVSYYDAIATPLQITVSFYNTGWFYYTALISQQAVLAGPRDIWGHVKIPFLNPDSETDVDGWAGTDPTSALDYSAFVGFPMLNVVPGNTTLSIQTEYIRLDCEPVTAITTERSTNIPGFTWNESSSETTLHRLPDSYTANASPMELEKEQVPNGTWYGEQNNDTVKWNIGLDRFIGQFWLKPTSFKWLPGVNGSKGDFYTVKFRPHELNDFAKEVGIEAGPTNLLFQARREVYCIPDEPMIYQNMNSQCRVLQAYVESRIICSRSTESSRSECRVTAQRPSKLPRANENISLLSTPLNWGIVTREMPTLMPKDLEKDPIIKYLFNNSAETTDGYAPTDDLTKTDAREFSARLSQVLNSYLLINRDYFRVDARDEDYDLPNDSVEEKKRWAQVAAETTESRYVYLIHAGWMAICIISCSILAIGGIIGVIFTHINNGPEILGYVSTILRESRLVDSPPSMDQLDGCDMSKAMKRERFQYGYYMELGEQMGIRRERVAREL